MKFLLPLAWASAWNRRATLGLTLLAVILASCLLLAVERLRHDAQESFAQSVSGTDLIVGARGSPLQLVLYAVFRLGDASNNIAWESYRKIAADPAVAWTIPLSLGDSHRGYPVLGTSSDYFRYFHYGLKTPLVIAGGRPFTDGRDDLFSAVLGAEVAQQLGYRLGQRIVLSHGSGPLPGLEHADKPFTVVGILAPTGTPVDRTVHVGLAAIEAIHLDWQGGMPLPGVEIPPALVDKFDLTPREITAFLVGLHQRTAVFGVQRRIAGFKDEPLQAALPGVVLDQLWQSLAFAEHLLRGLSWLILGLGLAGLLAVMLAGLGERRRELAILRALGAGLPQIAALLLLESLFLGLLGAGGGLLLLTAASFAAGPWLAANAGIVLHSLSPGREELGLLAAIVATCLLAGLLPAWRASRLALADGLTPRL
ncbi:ABC transporter permease [Quatrionicoccus australiensis]|uniref:ABC transporter permease n=1 Tax=Quatrionicoccus australiensis TaxID=138118 RepID=UPI001CF855A6|nr:ABC transporter permease [Quatrionicoccus australiensis]UCV16743.1 ABC transporter permease [Quatrionicoccus australiensis]